MNQEMSPNPFGHVVRGGEFVMLMREELARLVEARIIRACSDDWDCYRLLPGKTWHDVTRLREKEDA